MTVSDSTIREDIISRLRDTMTKERVGDHTLYRVGWSWNGKEEKYYFTARDLCIMVDDILDEHPRVWEYRVAQHMVNDLDRQYLYDEGWEDIKMDIIDPSAKGGKPLMMRLFSVRNNPTKYLYGGITDHEQGEKVSKYRCHLLVNKLWRTKKDYTEHRSIGPIMTDMISSLMRDPLGAMRHNSYIYATLKDNATLITQ